MPPPDKGPLVGGIALAWGIALFLGFGVYGDMRPGHNLGMSWLELTSPLSAPLILAIVSIVAGHRHQGIGLLLSLASIVAIVLLLLAGCFGRL